MVPPTIGFMVQIVKGTSVASLIGLTELARTATVINTVTFEPALVFGTVALIYFALCWPLSLLGAAMERRLRIDTRRPARAGLPDLVAQAVAGRTRPEPAPGLTRSGSPPTPPAPQASGDQPVALAEAVVREKVVRLEPRRVQHRERADAIPRIDVRLDIPQQPPAATSQSISAPDPLR